MIVEVPNTEIVIEDSLDVSVGSCEVEVVDLADLDVTVSKKEYVITGDEIYIPMLYDDAPQWMKDLVQVVVDVAVDSSNQGLVNDLNAIVAGFATSYVPLNQYTQSIVDLNDEDGRLNALIETLNSNFSDGLSSTNAQIVSLQLTKASKDEVVAQVIQTIAAQLADNSSNIGATIGRIDQAIADETSARASSFEVLTSSLEDTNLDVTANATATSLLNTYVGLELGAPNGTGLLADVEILQKQNDGVIETTTGTYDVIVSPENPDLAQLVVTAEPYATWKAADVSGIDTRLAHIGDVYVKYADTSNGAKEYVASYKFIRTIVDSTSPYATDSDGFTWALIVDQVAQDAYEQALNAYDLADNKRRVFTVTPSGPYDTGDLWVRVVSGSNQIWKCQATRGQLGYYNAADWSIASTDDTATVALQTGLADGTVTVKLTNAYVGTTPFLTYLTNEIDSKVGVYSGETAPVAGQPSGVAANDIYLWFTTASKVLANGTTQVYDITRTYKYSGSVWNEITTDSNITALADLADGKRTVFSGNTVPVGAVARDIWIPSATNGSYLQGEIYQYSGAAWVVATKYSADLEAVRSNLQSQVDGKVETYYQATVPTGMTSVNNGDYWYCTADVSTYKKGKVYKYVHATTSWVETADVSRYAFDTADGKAAIFLSTSTPTTGYKINDMLIVIGSFNNGTTTFSDGVVLSSNASRVSGFTASDWVKKINDTEDLDAFVSVTYTPTVTSLQNQVDGKIESWYVISTSDPKSAWTDAPTRAKHDGDMWYQIDTKLSYYYSSSTNAWNLIDDAKAIQALADAATAQATADGKISSYYMSTLALAQSMSSAWTPTEKTNNVGDLVVIWNDSTLDNNGTWRWNGTSWVTTRDKKLVALASDVTELSTELDNGTNTWASADSNLENSLMTEISDEGARVESKFAYNSLLNINGVYKKSGFGLTTNYVSGSGTQIDPYVSEFWIDASRFKFTNSNVTGSVAPFTIDASGANPQIEFNGVVNFSNVKNTTGTGSNLLYNSAPKIGSETKGWYVWTNSGMVVNLSAGFDIWKPTGGASVAASITGNPSIGSVYDIGQSSRFPVIAGSRYEASAYISAHRSNSYVYLIFYDTSGTPTGEAVGNVINYAGSNALVNWGRSSVFTTAPGNAATALLIIRSIVTGNDPFCFVTNAFAGVAEANQTTPSNWSEGTSVSISSVDVVTDINNAQTTTINGPRITTGSITAAQIDVNNLFAQNITYTGTITGGNVAGGGIIKSYNNKMTIDLVNGSIYIA